MSDVSSEDKKDDLGDVFGEISDTDDEKSVKSGGGEDTNNKQNASVGEKIGRAHV